MARNGIDYYDHKINQPTVIDGGFRPCTGDFSAGVFDPEAAALIKRIMSTESTITDADIATCRASVDACIRSFQLLPESKRIDLDPENLDHINMVADILETIFGTDKTLNFGVQGIQTIIELFKKPDYSNEIRAILGRYFLGCAIQAVSSESLN